MVGAKGGSPELKHFTGELLWPDHPAYNEARASYNSRWTPRPALIARCRNNSDTVAALRWAREKGLEIAIRSAGITYGPFSISDGVIIDTALMRNVRVDPVTKVARLSGGSTTGDVQAEAALFGLAAPSGLHAHLGMGTLLGGGTGHIRNRVGWAALNILSATLADGRLVEASINQNPDLLWGARGAAYNFGVVTSLEMRLYDVSRRITMGTMTWREPRLELVLRAVRDLSARASRNLAIAFINVDNYATPFMGTAASAVEAGVPIAQLLYTHSGTPDQAEVELGWLRRACTPDGEALGPTDFLDAHYWMNVPSARKGMDTYAHTELTDAVIDLLCAQGRKMGIPGTRRFIELIDQRGALAEAPSIRGAFRQLPGSAWSIRPQVTYRDPTEDALHDAWMDDFVEALRKTEVGAEDVVLANVVSRPVSNARVRACFRDAYDRLAMLKAEWDPENVFHKNFNIRPYR